MASSNSEWEQRRLCSDGNCIGIIGTNGRCKVCGLPDDPKAASAVADSGGADDGVKDVYDVPPVVAEDASDASPVAEEDAYQDDEPVAEEDAYQDDEPVAEEDAYQDDEPVAEEDAYQDDEPVIAVEFADDSWEERTLCVDESCIGVVGDDGRCNACGKPCPR